MLSIHSQELNLPDSLHAVSTISSSTSGSPLSTESSAKFARKYKDATSILPGDFEAEAHYYPRVLNANIHPLVASFFSLGNERILARYSHLNPQMDLDTLRSILEYEPAYFHWAGNAT